MLRFIIKREIKDGYNGLVDSGFETVDIDVPDLEHILTGGGFSEHSYDHRSLVGVEVRSTCPTGADKSATQAPSAAKKEGQP